MEEKQKYRNYEIEIIQDSDARNPRTEWDNLGHMACSHRRYELGDEQPEPEEIRALTKRKDILFLPLYLLDHSGITMRTSDFKDFDPQEWDSGIVGIIYVTFEEIRKEYGVKRITKSVREKALSVLRAEVSTYDDYLTGNVFGYSVNSPEGEFVDSCWGYYGDDGLKEALSNAKNAVDYDIKKKSESHFAKLRAWITNHVPLQARVPFPFL